MFDFLMTIMMAPPQGEDKSNWTTQLLPLLLIVVVFYLFFIRPQTRKNKELKKFREELKKGDKVITSGGVHGKVLEIQDNTVIIETEGQGKLKIEKASIVTEFKAENQSQSK